MTASGIFSVSIKEDGAKKHACEKRALDMQINLHWNMFFFFLCFKLINKHFICFWTLIEV